VTILVQPNNSGTNSDDPEVLETNVNNEYRIAHEILGMGMEDIAACNRFAFEASFIEEAAKQRIWNKYFKETLNPN